MKLIVFLFCWCVLFLLCWPLALLLIVLVPLFWLVLLPFRLAWIVTEACLALIKALLFLPARLLGHRAAS
jgi:hypothetical protein